MHIDLRNVPFSRNGAYMAFSLFPDPESGRDALFLRSVHGDSLAVSPGGVVAKVEVIDAGEPVPCKIEAGPARLELFTAKGSLSICFADPYLVRARGQGLGLRLTFDSELGSYAFFAAEGRCQVNAPAFKMQWMLTPLAGNWRLDAPWTGSAVERLVIDLLPGADGLCEGALEEFTSAWIPREYEESFEDCVALVEADFYQWLDQTPALPEAYEESRRLAAYVTWSSMVEPGGHLLRPAMLMSKNFMTNIWAWDHCFNAMALTYRMPISAWDQIMTLFDQQDELGALPDCVNDRGMLWNFCKPPIHGWTLNWMMQHTGFVRVDQLHQIYGPLCRWTEWWFRYRDDDGDGLPQYHHGNDSGWDNATPFQAGVPLESPDLCAFLVLQMEALARMARLLNNSEEAESWQRRSEELLEMMLAHFWQGDHFVALRSGDHLVADSESLFLYLPLILGKRLPQGVWRELVSGLARPGRFLTPHGLATESPRSPAYESDGYWRGPIWAPPTLMIVEGLASCGEIALARDIARRFCDTVARAGFAENFDALSGAPLRDRAYTWTASVFLVLGHEYLIEE